MTSAIAADDAIKLAPKITGLNSQLAFDKRSDTAFLLTLF
jgi:hypothetical protein